MTSSLEPAANDTTRDLLLKVTPPRVPRHLVARERLKADDPHLLERPVILVQAPGGFGKTSLLAQWRREHLARGAVVAWLSAQAQDEPRRLVQSLALAVRTGSGRSTFGHVLLEGPAPGGPEGITIWLAEVAQSALNVVLLVDEADRLPEGSREALAYLLRNAPPNLLCIVAARSDCQLGIDDLIAYGQCVVVGPSQLRLRIEETIELVRSRFGTQFDRDTAARLHEMTEGWPLGLQLALAVLSGTEAKGRRVATLQGQGLAIRDQFVSVLLANLEPADLAFLTRVSVLDPLHPQLCRAVLASDDAPERLLRLGRDTPIFVASEQSEWLRMHALAREALRQRFLELPTQEQADLHARAAAWLAANGLIEAAASHMLQSGQHQQAYDLAERSLYEALVQRGRHGTVLEWVSRLPAEELDRRPRLLLAAAWSLGTSERHEQAQQLVARILARPDVDDALRCECALILGSAAVFADDPDRFAQLHQPWAEAPPLRDPLLLQMHANRTAFLALINGEPALARLRQQQAAGLAPAATDRYIRGWGVFIIGLSYLWEGQVLPAERLLRPALAEAEADIGRRSPFTCMLASLLAATLWERDQPEEAAAVMANRLDVLERSGLAECVLLGYRTIARIAIAAGAEHRAAELLSALDAVGSARRLPRLRVASLVDQVRMHARRFRPETCRDLCAQIDTLVADPHLPQGPLWQRSVRLLQDLAHGYAAVAAQDWRRALEPLARADTVARQIRQVRLHIEVLGLRAYALDRCGERSEDLLREALDLARSIGLQRVFADTHPALGDWVRRVAGDAAAPAAIGTGTLAAPMRAPVPARDSTRLRATPSMALTPKEREVLELLARNLSNKEIGLAMQVGEETIKWHMKNLFSKLDAGTRKQVVRRACILGLLEAAD